MVQTVSGRVSATSGNHHHHPDRKNPPDLRTIMTNNRNRTPTGQIRDDFLLETNFDDDGALTRAYNTLPQQQAALNSGLQRRSLPYRSNLSVDRYSETTLHGKPPRKGIYRRKHVVAGWPRNTAHIAAHYRKRLCVPLFTAIRPRHQAK
uniref:Uncharacterized protein n=1 Tax=Anopheles maculatus TaxID=74869 RepID=A0A182S5G4_9DIPT